MGFNPDAGLGDPDFGLPFGGKIENPPYTTRVGSNDSVYNQEFLDFLADLGEYGESDIAGSTHTNKARPERIFQELEKDQGPVGEEGETGPPIDNTGLAPFAPNNASGFGGGAAGHPSGQGSTNGAFSGQPDADSGIGDPDSTFGKVVSFLARAMMPMPFNLAINAAEAMANNEAHAKLGFLDKNDRMAQLAFDLDPTGIFGKNSNIDAANVVANRTAMGMPANVFSGKPDIGSQGTKKGAQAMTNAIANQAAKAALSNPKSGLSSYGKYGGNATGVGNVGTPSNPSGIAGGIGVGQPDGW